MSRPSLGARLRERRAARGINQYQAGAEIGIGQTAVSRTERGGAIHPATVARVEQWLAQPTPPPVEVAVQAPDALSPPSPPDPPRDGTEDAAASGGDLPRRSAVPELVDATPLRPAAPAVDDAAEWHDGPFWVHQREQIDHPVPPGWWVCHEYFERPDASGSRRVAVGQHRGEAHARGRSNASRWPAPADVPEEALGYPPAPRYVAPDAFTQAGDEIARICGCPTWEYPGQLVRDVRALADERDALRLERDSLRAQNLGWRRHNDALATFLGAEPGQDDEVLRIAAAIHREAQGETGDDAAEVNWPRERHEEILDLLRQAHGGELPAWARAADLVYLHDQAQHPTRPAPVPGRRELQTRWGVSERETKASLADEAWRSKAAAAKVRVVAREAQGETGDDAAEVMASVIRGRTDAFEDRDAALEGLASVLGEDVAAPLVPREVDAARRRIREPLEAALGSGELVRGLTLPGLADEAERVIGELRTTADRYLASNRLLEAELTGHRERPPTLFVATDFGCSASPDVLALLEELGERASRSGLRVPRRGGPAGLLAYLIGWLEAHGVITAPSPEAP